MPKQMSERLKKEKFYEKLISAMEKSDIVLGDLTLNWTAQYKNLEKGSINENGFLLNKAMLEAKHTATNTKFRHKYCNITAWKSNTNQKENI